MALYRSIIKKRVVALVRYIRASNAGVRLALLVPQEEEEVDGQQVTPPGLQMIMLPFLDDIRTVDQAEHGSKVGEPMLTYAKDMVQLVQAESFSSEDFANPSLQKHYSALQALALQETELDWNEARDDKTMPKDEEVIEAGRQVLENFAHCCSLDDGESAETGSKRKAAAGGSKKVKEEATDKPPAKRGRKKASE